MGPDMIFITFAKKNYSNFLLVISAAVCRVKIIHACPFFRAVFGAEKRNMDYIETNKTKPKPKACPEDHVASCNVPISCLRLRHVR